MHPHPILRRAVTPELSAELRWDEPLKLNRAVVSWAIAIDQLAKDPADLKAARAAADAIARGADDALAATAASLDLPEAPGPAALRGLFEALGVELFRMLAARGEAEGELPGPRRARGPAAIGAPLSEVFRRAFGTWLSWELFDPYSARQLAWGAAACAAELDRRLDADQRTIEAERLTQLVARWDTPSLLALERCTVGSWLENDVTEDALAGVLEDIAARLGRPPPAPPATRPRVEPLPIGQVDWPVGLAARFESPNAQLQAKRRAERLLQAEAPPKTVWIDDRLFPNLVSYVVAATGDSGFGSGAVVERDASGRPRPGRPVKHAYQLGQARVILGSEQGRWSVLTYYPTDEPALA